jgi:hypothetical protein
MIPKIIDVCFILALAEKKSRITGNVTPAN